MSNSLVPSFLVSDVRESLRWLTKNEGCERITQVAHQKWENAWMAYFFERIAYLLIFGQKTSNSLGKPMSEFPALPYTLAKEKNLTTLSMINILFLYKLLKNQIFLINNPWTLCTLTLFAYVYHTLNTLFLY